MTASWRRLENAASGEAFTFVETSEETGGARVVALIEVQPGGGPRPHAHPPRETFEPANDFERVMRALAGLARDGRLGEPGGRPAEPALMASLARRSGYYEPPMPRLLWNLLNGALAPFGRRAADEALARYDREHPSPGERVGELR